MTRPIATLLENPPQEDSDDLSDEEIEGAMDSETSSDVAQRVRQEILDSAFRVKAHELRRRGEDLFWRVRLVSGAVEKVLVFRANWLGG